MALGTSLQVQWLDSTSNAGDMETTSCQGAKIPHAAQCTQRKGSCEQGVGVAGAGGRHQSDEIYYNCESDRGKQFLTAKGWSDSTEVLLFS